MVRPRTIDAEAATSAAATAPRRTEPRLGTELRAARRALGLKQDELATRAGLSRMTIQRIEAGTIDPRVSTLEALVRALGLTLTLVPRDLRPALEAFIRAGGRTLGQPAGVAAPPSIVETLSPRRSGRSR